MPSMRIILDGDGGLPEMGKHIKNGTLVQVQDFAVAALPGGMQSGSPSVAIYIELPDGRAVFAETSLRLFLAAADALKARHGDPRSGQRGFGAKGGEG